MHNSFEYDQGYDAVETPWALLDALFDGYAILDASGTIQYCNAAWQRFFAQQPEPGHRFAPGDDYFASAAALFAEGGAAIQELHSSVQAVVQGNRKRAEVVLPYRLAGESRRLYISVIPTRVAGSRGVVLGQRAMPQVEQCEQELEQCRHAYATLQQRVQHTAAHIYETLPLATIELDNGGHVRYWSSGAERIFGWSAAEMHGTNALLRLFPDTTPDECQMFLDELHAADVPHTSRYDNSTSDERVIICQWHISVLPPAEGTVDGVGGLLALVEDISIQVHAEQERMTIQERMIEAQQEALRELSTPLIPISAGIVVMPLIGSVNRWRAQQMMQTMLEGIQQHRAAVVILDVTGVSHIDAQIAHDLLETVQAVRLLGAQVVLTGIRPDVAETLVRLDIDMRGIVTSSTLQSGIAYVLRRPRNLDNPDPLC